jgi:hypothetical protein
MEKWKIEWIQVQIQLKVKDYNKIPMMMVMMMVMNIDAFASNDPNNGDDGSLLASSPSGSHL